MTTYHFFRTLIIFPTLALGLAGLTGCEKQGQVLALREEFSRQLQAKDKTIDELNQKITELRNQNDQLQLQSAKGSGDPEKLAQAVADTVSRRITDQNAQSFGDLRRDLDQVLQAVKSGGGGSGNIATAPRVDSVPNVPSTRPPANTPPARDPSTPSDPNRKKLRFDFN